MADLLIGDVASRSGVNASTIRYYESMGLIAGVSRSAAGYRQYSETVVDQIQFIRNAQRLGFSLEELAKILQLTRTGQAPCAQVLAMARGHLSAVEARIDQLMRFRDHLAREIKKWDGRTEPTCQGLCEIILEAAASCPADVPPHVLRPSKTRG